jgi:hypothetical protein
MKTMIQCVYCHEPYNASLDIMNFDCSCSLMVLHAQCGEQALKNNVYRCIKGCKRQPKGRPKLVECNWARVIYNNCPVECVWCSNIYERSAKEEHEKSCLHYRDWNVFLNEKVHEHPLYRNSEDDERKVCEQGHGISEFECKICEIRFCQNCLTDDNLKVKSKFAVETIIHPVHPCPLLKSEEATIPCFFKYASLNSCLEGKTHYTCPDHKFSLCEGCVWRPLTTFSLKSDLHKHHLILSKIPKICSECALEGGKQSVRFDSGEGNTFLKTYECSYCVKAYCIKCLC